MEKFELLENTINELTDDRLVEVAEEIYSSQTTGNSSDDSFVNEISAALCISNRDVEDYVLNELSRRYKNLVLLLLKNRIKDFIQS